MTGGECSYDAVAPQRRDPQGGHQGAACDNSEIDLPALEAPQQSLACTFGIAKDDIGVCSAEFRREGRESSGQHAGLDSDGDLAILALARPPRASVHASYVIQDHLGPQDEFPTEHGRDGANRRAGEQPDIQSFLKLVQGTADGRLPCVQETRRTVDTAVLGDCPHTQQLPEVEGRSAHGLSRCLAVM